MTTPATVTADLNESASVVLDGSGNGSARLSPHGTRYSGYVWKPIACYVSVSTNVKEASATAYVSYGVQSATPNDAIGTTANGSTGDTCGMSQTLKPGDWITVKWTGGDAGAVATMRVTGVIDLPIPVATVRQ
jgi:hypothetical protein